MAESEASTTELGFHQLANLFPLMEGADFDELMHDIRENGLREPICVHECQILDGRNRYMACMVAGVEPRFEAFPVDGDGDPLAFVVSRNLHRRHLTVQQRAAIAAELATMKSGARTDLASNDARSLGLSDAQAAKVMNVSEPTVERAKRRMRTDPEAHAKAKAGTLGRAKPTKRIGKTRPIDGDREPAKPKRSLLDAMGAVGAFTPASAKRYCADHPDEAKRIADAVSVVAKIAAAVAPSPSSAVVEPESVVRNTGESETPGPLVATIIKAQEVLAGMAKVADAAEAGDRKALETVIAGAKLLTSLCVRMEQLAKEYARPDLRLVEPEEGLSPTKQWMQDHPDDVPCPRDPDAAKGWRQKRGIQPAPAPEAEQRISPRTGKPVRKYTKRNSNSAGY